MNFWQSTPSNSTRGNVFGGSAFGGSGQNEGSVFGGSSFGNSSSSVNFGFQPPPAATSANNSLWVSSQIPSSSPSTFSVPHGGRGARGRGFRGRGSFSRSSSGSAFSSPFNSPPNNQYTLGESSNTFASPSQIPVFGLPENPVSFNRAGSGFGRGNAIPTVPFRGRIGRGGRFMDAMESETPSTSNFDSTYNSPQRIPSSSAFGSSNTLANTNSFRNETANGTGSAFGETSSVDSQTTFRGRIGRGRSRGERSRSRGDYFPPRGRIERIESHAGAMFQPDAGTEQEVVYPGARGRRGRGRARGDRGNRGRGSTYVPKRNLTLDDVVNEEVPIEEPVQDVEFAEEETQDEENIKQEEIEANEQTWTYQQQYAEPIAPVPKKFVRPTVKPSIKIEEIAAEPINIPEVTPTATAGTQKKRGGLKNLKQRVAERSALSRGFKPKKPAIKRVAIVEPEEEIQTEEDQIEKKSDEGMPPLEEQPEESTIQTPSVESVQTSTVMKINNNSTLVGSKKDERSKRFGTLSESEQRLRQLKEESREKQQDHHIVQINLSQAKHIIGTCPDMCPEKERYEREQFQDLSIFEMEPGTEQDKIPRVRHEWAVKKFARPSVNLEGTETLPEEIRPVHMLNQTMDYLITRILDRSDVPFYEVHNFIRDRSRSIRQDITYQGLHDQATVEMVEQMTRFHIMSEHKLCEEDGRNFDEFQNMEQLNKCLISLRHFYEDLRQEGIECANEPEFRAYFVLTHIEGDVLAYCTQMTNKALNSKEVQFVLKIWISLQENNYYQFYRLVREADYLTACLMHKLFTQVRKGALRVINKTFAKEEPYSLDDLVELLCFEDKEEAEGFCSYCGITLVESGFQPRVTSYIDPKTKIPVRRSDRVIEPKAPTSLAEIVCGKRSSPSTSPEKVTIGVSPYQSPFSSPIIQPLPYKPATPLLASPKLGLPIKPDIIQIKPPEIIAPVPTFVKSTPSSPLIIPSASLKSTIPSGITFPVLPTPLPESLEHPVAASPQSIPTELPKKSPIIPSILLPLSPLIPPPVPTSPLIKPTPFPLFEFPPVTLPSTSQFPTFAIEEPRSFSPKPSIPNIFQAPIILPEQLDEIPAKPKKSKEELEELMNGFLLKREQNLLRNMFSKWKLFTNTKRLERKQKEEEIAAEKERYQSFINSLAGRNEDILMDAQIEPLRVSDKGTEYITASLEEITIQPRLSDNWSSLDIPKLLHRSFKSRNPNAERLYWKLVLCASSDNVDPEQSHHNWVISKLTRGIEKPQPVSQHVSLLSLYTSTDVEDESLEMEHRIFCSTPLSICIQNFTSSHSEVEQQELYGAQSLLFVSSVTRNQLHQCNKWELDFIRLQSLICSLPPNVINIPLGIILNFEVNQFTTSLVEKELKLSQFGSRILNYKLVSIESVKKGEYNNTELLESIRWLIENSPTIPQLRKATFTDIVNERVTVCTKELFLYCYKYLSESYPDTLLEGASIPSVQQFVIQFNQTLDQLQLEIANDSLASYSWPIPEFVDGSDENLPPLHWNSFDTLRNIKNLLTLIQLPVFKIDESVTSYNLVFSYCMKYIQLIFKKNSSELQSIQLQLDSILTNYFLKKTASIPLPWHQIFEAIYYFRIGQLLDDDVFFIPQDNLYQRIKWEEPVILKLPIESTAQDVGKKRRTPPALHESELQSAKSRHLDEEVNMDNGSFEHYPTEELNVEEQQLTEIPNQQGESIERQTFYEPSLEEYLLRKTLETEKEENRKFEELLSKLARS